MAEPSTVAPHSCAVADVHRVTLNEPKTGVPTSVPHHRDKEPFQVKVMIGIDPHKAEASPMCATPPKRARRQQFRSGTTERVSGFSSGR